MSQAQKDSLTAVHFISLGCARNMVDTEVMAGLLNRDGYTITGAPESADVIVVNTCGFIDSAKKESVDTILEAAQYKNKDVGRCQKLVVAGCLAERYPGELKESLPEIDLVMGTASFNKIVDEIERLKVAGSSSRIAVYKDRLKDYDLPRLNSQPFYTAYLKLAEGCAKKCSFCIIPQLRGPLRSRSIETLVKETQDLVKSGVKELNLIAQDLTDFGRDRKDGTTLAALLRELVKIEDLQWIRLFYVYPDQLDDEVIELIATEDKICKYLDVPVQHISDRILKDMNRKTTGLEIKKMLVRLRKRIPNLVIRTSLMVGFPGESAEEFDELNTFVAEGLLDHIGVFTYSHEEDTASFKKFKDDVPQKTKLARQKKIYATQEHILQEKLAGWIGQEVDALIEGAHDETPLLLKARHFGQGPGVDNITLINEGQAAVGSIVKIKINERVGIDLMGQIL